MIKGDPTKRAVNRAALRQREKQLEAAVAWLESNPRMGPADALRTGEFTALGSLEAFKGMLKRRRANGGGGSSDKERLSARDQQMLLTWEEEEELVSMVSRAERFDQTEDNRIFISLGIRGLLLRRQPAIFTSVELPYVNSAVNRVAMSHVQLITRLAKMQVPVCMCVCVCRSREIVRDTARSRMRRVYILNG